MSAPPVLTSAAGNGGIVAQDGFDYQLFYGVARIAEWLGDTTFEGVMFEALEDVEARFFAPQSDLGHLLIRIQAKSGSLDRADILAVLDNFVAFEQHYPGTAKAFELVTPQLPAKMNWIVRDLERVRFADPTRPGGVLGWAINWNSSEECGEIRPFVAVGWLRTLTRKGRSQGLED